MYMGPETNIETSNLGIVFGSLPRGTPKQRTLSVYANVVKHLCEERL